MATPGLMYRIGGVLDPSFNGVLALSVVKSREAAEAQAAAFRKSAAQINATNLRGNLWQARKDEAIAAGVAVGGMRLPKTTSRPFCRQSSMFSACVPTRKCSGRTHAGLSHL